MAKVSINQQIEEITRVIAETRSENGRKVAGGKLRQSEADYDLHRQDAIFRTLCFCRDEERLIRAIVAMTPDDREAVISHGDQVAAMARELVRREEIAKAGGPAR